METRSAHKQELFLPFRRHEGIPIQNYSRLNQVHHVLPQTTPRNADRKFPAQDAASSPIAPTRVRVRLIACSGSISSRTDNVDPWQISNGRVQVYNKYSQTVKLVDRSAALRAGFARDDPDGVAAFKTGRATTTRDLFSQVLAGCSYAFPNQSQEHSQAWS